MEFEILVYKMRQAQKKYFKGRSQEVLQEAKQYEAAVDRHLAKLNINIEQPKQPGLF